MYFLLYESVTRSIDNKSSNLNCYSHKLHTCSVFPLTYYTFFVSIFWIHHREIIWGIHGLRKEEIFPSYIFYVHIQCWVSGIKQIISGVELFLREALGILYILLYQIPCGKYNSRNEAKACVMSHNEAHNLETSGALTELLLIIIIIRTDIT